MIVKALKEQLITGFVIVFAILWIFLIGIDYVNKHPAYNYAFQYFRFTGLFIQLFVFSAVLLAWEKLAPKALRIPINGLSLFALGSIVVYLIIVSNKDLVNFRSNSSDYFLFLGTTLLSAIQIAFLVLICRSTGRAINIKYFNNYFKTDYLLDIGLGLIVFVCFMFIAGIFGFLNSYCILIILAVMSVLNIKFFFKSVIDFFLKSIPKKDLSLLGYAAAVIIFIFLLINFVSVQTGFPSGFDSRNYYINISNLIAKQGYLIAGYPPYNGSLICGIGLIFFDQIELALSLSFFGIVLSTLMFYRIGVKKLNFDKNKCMFLLAIILVTPALVNQMFVELKSDYWMLYYQILAVYYLFEFLPKLLKLREKELDLKQRIKSSLPMALLLGLLVGFGMGIKMINMFLLVVLLFLIWWDHKNKYAITAVIFLTVSIFLFGGVDEISGLRSYHYNVNILRIALAVLGLLFIAISFYFHRNSTIQKCVFSFLFVCSILVSLSPWIAKNYSDTKSLNPKTILMGDAPGPKISVTTMKRRYERSKDK